MNLNKITNLCERFGVNFSISTNTDSTFPNLVYEFGPIKWMKYLDNPSLTEEDFYNISLHLAATFPDKVLK